MPIWHKFTQQKMPRALMKLSLRRCSTRNSLAVMKNTIQCLELFGKHLQSLFFPIIWCQTKCQKLLEVWLFHWRFVLLRFMSTDSLLCGDLKRRLLFIPIILGVEVLRSNCTAYFRRLAMLILFVFETWVSYPWEREREKDQQNTFRTLSRKPSCICTCRP